MSRLSNLGIPDLPQQAFQRDARGHIKPQGGKGSTPKAPDYVAAAEATAAGNLELAKYATQANRVNQYTPWGSLTYTNDRVFDQAGYDAALATYNQATQGRHTTGAPIGYINAYTGSGDYDRSFPVPVYGDGIGNASVFGVNFGSKPTAPNPEDFWTGGDNWSQHINLSPEMQAMLDQQNRIQMGLFGSQDAALGRVNQAMAGGFNTSGLPAGGTALDMNGLPAAGQAYNPQQLGIDLSSLPGMGNVLNTGQLSAMPNALRQSDLSPLGDVLDTGRLPAMGNVFSPTGQMLDVYDPNLQTNNATELLLSRINPNLDRQGEQLRAQLAQQGIVQGSEAYNNAMMQHQQGRNDAYNQAALAGIGLGMQQQGMMFNQGLQNRQLLAGEQAQQYQQQMANRAAAVMEQAQQYMQQTQNRQMTAQEQQQLWNQMMGARQQGVNEQALQFDQQQALRMGEAGLLGQNAMLGMQQQAQQFGQQNYLRELAAALQGQQFNQAEQARQRAYQELAYERGLPFQELVALSGGNQVQMPQFPGYAQQATTGGPDILGATNAGYQAQLGAYNADQAAGANMMSGLFGLGNIGIAAYGAGLFSDRRLKRNIKRVGSTDDGLGIYTYQYVWGGPVLMGVMADEVERVAPHAVGEVGGYKTVNYGAL